MGLSKKGKHVLIQVRWNTDNPEEAAAFAQLIEWAAQAAKDSARDPMRLIFVELVSAYAGNAVAPRFGDPETRVERMIQREFAALHEKLDNFELAAPASDGGNYREATVEPGIDEGFYEVILADHRDKGGER